ITVLVIRSTMLQATFIVSALLAFHSTSALIDLGCIPACTGDRLPARQATKDYANDALNRTRALIDQVIAASYPDLKDADIRIKAFRSRSDYFKARFGFPEYFFTRMRYLVFVNPRAFELQAPEEGVRAIIAHELAHVVYFKKGNRVRLLGLVRLTSKQSTARFERWADLEAISLGYGEGLKEYRSWLYGNVPASKLADKQRNYFSPAEIDAILSASRKRPELLEYWLKHVPLSLSQILNASSALPSRFSGGRSEKDH
ncbi:MAG TPA: hypothetical protein VNS63_07845, partial [Blastocatellia bacterium]|nr:hypothetical protein [Blastocatellia bacterium]